MKGKHAAIAFGAGFLAGVLIYLYDVTVGPAIEGTVKGTLGGLTKA